MPPTATAGSAHWTPEVPGPIRLGADVKSGAGFLSALIFMTLIDGAEIQGMANKLLVQLETQSIGKHESMTPLMIVGYAYRQELSINVL